MISSSARTSLALLGALCAACQVDAQAGAVSRVALGIHVETPRDDAAKMAALTAREALIGRGFDVDRQYHDIDADVAGAYEQWTAAQGRVPLVSVISKIAGGMLTWKQIADVDDARATAILTAFAERVRAFGQPIELIFHDEAQDDVAFGTPEEYVAAFRRVVELFRTSGVDNAQWVFQLKQDGYPTLAERWYPGDAWVDWIGASGFNSYPNDQWRTFAAVFAPFYAWAHDRGKPLAITAYASNENLDVAADDPHSKATWIRQSLDSLADWPEIQQVVWFDGTGAGDMNWLIDSSPATLDAYRALAAAPLFDTTGQSLTPYVRVAP